MNLEKYNQLLKKLEQARSDNGRAEGRAEQLFLQLKEEHGVGTVEEAEKLLKKLSKQEAIKKQEIEKQLAEFEKDFGDKL